MDDMKIVKGVKLKRTMDVNVLQLHPQLSIISPSFRFSSGPRRCLSSVPSI
jgi:hypothetical protein